MAWTTANLTAIEAAITAIATGAVSYTINGRTVTKANLGELRSLRREMQAELGQRRIIRTGRVNEDQG